MTPPSNNNEVDGETDFILAHPGRGLLFVEVKGGRVSRRESDDQWLSVNRDGIEFKIKDPVAQARRSKHNILRKLREDRRLSGSFIEARHAVILPGCRCPSRDLGPDAPLEIFAFGDDMDRLGKWVETRMPPETAQESGFGTNEMRALRELLKGRFELAAHIGMNLGEDSEKIAMLTAEQAEILESFEDNRKMAISGGAGSGKTVLAIEKAVRATRAGRRTLLTCFNSPLAAYLESVAGDEPNLVVSSFHSLCSRLAMQADIQLTQSASQREHFSTILPEALSDAVELEPALKFDCIVVDEGQDFEDLWLDALQCASRDGDTSEFYVFYDDNQNLYREGASFVRSLPPSHHRLTKNLRNTRRIHEAMQKWYSGRPNRSVGPEGEPVGWTEVRHADQACGRLNERVVHMLRSGEVQPGQIAILTGSGRGVLPKQPERIGGVRICAADAATPETMVFDTVRRFKGLSRPCVFVFDIENLESPELIYVALSRANVLLEVFGTKQALERLKGGSGSFV